MSVAGFFILLAMAILLRLAGSKLIPVVMPPGVSKLLLQAGLVDSWVAG